MRKAKRVSSNKSNIAEEDEKKKFGWYQANCEKKMSKNKQKY